MTLRGNPEKTIKSLCLARKRGPWTLTAIHPEDGPLEVITFEGAEELSRMRSWIAQRDGKKNLYWTCNPTREAMTRKPTKGDIARAELAYVDCDPLPDETSAEGKRRHLEALTSLATPPTLIIDTGNGYCAIWKLHEPVVFAPGDTTAIAEYEATNRGLIDALGGKKAGVDACYSVEHLMRLPHTVNLPNAKKRAAGRVPVVAGSVKRFPERVYSLADLPKALPSDVLSTSLVIVGAADEIDLERLAIPDDIKRLICEGAAQGERSEAIYRVLRALHSARVSPEEMLGILIDQRYRVGQRFDWQEDRARDEVARVIGKAKTELEQDFADPIDEHHLADEAEAPSVEARGLSVKGNSAKADDSFMNALHAVGACGIDPALNVLSNSVIFRKPRWDASYGAVFNDNLLRVVRVLLANLWQGNAYEPSEKNTFDAIMTLAFRSQFNPVLDYLDDLAWDGVERLDRLFVDYFPCGDDAYTRAVAPCFGVAAVRRQRQPGCKFDTIPIMLGPQGWGKSTGVQALCGSEWFSDADMGNLKDKDAAMKLRGAWIVEFGELDSLNRADTATLKAFLSRGTDRQRDPYGRIVEDFARRCVFFGTGNEEGALKDSTGARRYWPLKLRGRVAVERIVADRDQLWAEAATREAKGESIVLPEELWPLAAVRQQAQTTEDPWLDALRDFISERERAWVAGEFETFDRPEDEPLPPDRVHSIELLQLAIGIPTDRQNKNHSQRLRTLMEQGLGWNHVDNVRVRAKQGKGYVREE